MRIRDFFQHFIFSILTAGFFLLSSCAVQEAPSGGPKDTTPPEVLKSVPANNSINFEDNRITLTFSEFVTLKEINNQLVVSPPVKETPEFILRGKNLTMKFMEPLRENSTYNFFFGDAIVDITEANPLSNYNFSLSTGPVLDSLSIKGILTDAFNLKPVEGAFVMLYDTIYDSVPYLQRPYYLAKTNKNGEFILNNLRDSKYMMFALTDINSNYLYDLPSEKIAFSDSLITPQYFGAQSKDALPSDTSADSISLEADSTKATLHFIKNDSLKTDVMDSLTINKTPDSLSGKEIEMKKNSIPSYSLYHFLETDTTQQLQKGTVLRNNVISLVFRQPLKSFTFTPIKPLYEGNWAITSFNRNLDSLTIWVKNPLSDSLVVEVADMGIVLDTLYLALVAQVKENRGKDQVAKPIALGMRSGIKGSKIRPDRDLVITFEDPIAEFRPQELILYADTLPVSTKIFFQDSLQLKLHVNYPWKEGIKYRFEIPDSTFTSIFGNRNDSTTYKFTPFTEEETGQIKLTIIPHEEGQYIIQLLDEKEVIIQENLITKESILTYNYLPAKKYIFKAIRDLNANEKWDTGQYLQKQQPEPVYYFSTVIELRSNWTIEEEWIIE
ncbi:MAG: Ig-like domain-containing protein [Lentimicrobium sp.]|jgi:hypothetical protein|nr:Ig-like domain-containing protein [Lentimicrobium sp.]